MHQSYTVVTRPFHEFGNKNTVLNWHTKQTFEPSPPPEKPPRKTKKQKSKKAKKQKCFMGEEAKGGKQVKVGGTGAENVDGIIMPTQ